MEVEEGGEGEGEEEGEEGGEGVEAHRKDMRDLIINFVDLTLLVRYAIITAAVMVTL